MTDNEKKDCIEDRFEYLCSKQWAELNETGDKAVKHCDQCNESVHLAQSMEEVDEHARQGHCVAIKMEDKDRRHDKIDALGYLRPKSEKENDALPPGYLDLPIFLGRPADPPEPESKANKVHWFKRFLGILGFSRSK